MKITQFIFVLLTQLFQIAVAAPPSPLKCWLWDSTCLTSSAQAISPILAAGVPELDMQPLDTVVIDYIHIDKGGFKADLRSIVVKGMGDGVVDSISVDMSTKRANFIFHTDLEAKGRYINNGTLLSSHIYGDGSLTMDFENVQITMNIPFDVIEDAHGKNLMLLKSYDYIYDVKGGAQFRLDNLFNGDKNLSDIMHRKLNENWKFLTIMYGRYFFDPLTEKIFNSVRNYIRSKPIEAVALYAFK